MSTTNSGLLGFFDSIVIILSTPYLIAALTGVLLNGILPTEADDGAPAAGAGGVVVHPDDLVGPSAEEQERREEEVELDDKKFALEPSAGAGSNGITLSREVV